jgi:steroid delta-isomerase-like uncharacterized protein
MLKVQISREINRPIQEVFAYGTDPATTPDWRPAVLECKSEPPGQVRVGSKIHTVLTFLGHRIEGTAEVTELVPSKKLVQKTNSPFPLELTFLAEPTRGGTKVTVQAVGEPRGFFKLAGPVLSRVVRKQGQAELDTMKSLLEARNRPRSATSKEGSVSVEESMAIVRRFADEILNEKKLDKADEIMAQDYVDHAAMPGQAPGLLGFKSKGSMWLVAVPDLRVSTEDMFADGNRVAVRWTAEGTQSGNLLGIPASGRSFRFTGMSIFRLAAGKIAEQWEEWDKLNLMQQLGAVPAAGHGTR